MLKSCLQIAFFTGTSLLAACDLPEPGDRPPDDCPAGETCSDSPPTRLYFSGAGLGDSFDGRVGPYAVAVGGTQSIHVWLDSKALRPFDAPIGVPMDTTPACPGAFCAITAGAGVIAIVADPPVVTVTGVHLGQEELRITAPFRRDQLPEQLYDRIAVDVAMPDTLSVVSPRDLEFILVHGDRAKNMPIAFAVGSSPEAVVVGMFATRTGDVRRVVDESLSLSATVGNLVMRPGQWDSLVPTRPFDQPGTHSIVATTHGAPIGQATLLIVDSISSLAIAAGGVGVPDGTALVTGVRSRMCFSAFASAAEGTSLVYGAKVTPVSSSSVEETAVAGNTNSQIAASCIDVRAQDPGQAAIQVRHNEQNFSFSVRVCPASGCPASIL